jgi:hypothetical protein
MLYLCIMKQNGFPIPSNNFLRFSMLYFLKTCILQGVKTYNVLLFSILNKNRFPVSAPVISCYFP